MLSFPSNHFSVSKWWPHISNGQIIDTPYLIMYYYFKSVSGKSKHLCGGYKWKYKNMCQPVSINYIVCNPQGKHFWFYLERVSNLLYGLLLSSAPDKTLTREALNTGQQLLPRRLCSCRQHFISVRTRMLPAVASASPRAGACCWAFSPRMMSLPSCQVSKI